MAIELVKTFEQVACSYTATSNTPQTSPSVTLKLPVKIYDTHNAWGTGTGQFTAPMNGKYRVSLIGSLGGGEPVQIYKNSINYMWFGRSNFDQGQFMSSIEIDLLGGETIDIRCSSSASSATSWGGGSLSSAGTTTISISRIA